MSPLGPLLHSLHIIPIILSHFGTHNIEKWYLGAKSKGGPCFLRLFWLKAA